MLSPWFIFGGSGVSLRELGFAARGELPDTIKLTDVADFVVATRQGGGNLIGVLHSLGYTRGMLEALGFPEGKRVASMLKYAVLGDTPAPAVPSQLSAGQRTWAPPLLLMLLLLLVLFSSVVVVVAVVVRSAISCLMPESYISVQWCHQ
ncbi:unnamed protein product [Polarella glacialis]|uniref:Uncharacterized protein n=1 Tax=Polarella glacialis TaxID=89957 RepID=A0A813G434_POLGL|nr:unnamed protein product [Polarella glacialis]